MNINRTHRVLAGSPKGGQFRHHERSADAINLSKRQSTTDRLPSTGVVDPAVALLIARRLARQRSGRFAFAVDDQDDVAQSALLSVLTSENNGRVNGLTPGLISSAVDHAVANAIMQRTFVDRHEDAKALKQLRVAEERLAQQLGRELTRADIDTAAAEIRDEWADPRHKPRRGFQNAVRLEPLEGETSIEARAIPWTREPERGELNDLADRVDDGEISLDEAKRRLWNSVAKVEALPHVTERTRSAKETARLQRRLKNAGGVAEVAGRYLESGVITIEMLALMAPFSVRAAESERLRALAGHLASRGRVAQRLWDAAAAASTE